MTVRQIDHDELAFMIGRHYLAKIPLYIWGGTGIGKSDTVREQSRVLAEKNNREYKAWNKLSSAEKHEIAEHPEKYFVMMDIRLSQLDPSDLRGLPALNGKNVVEWKIPFWLDYITKPDAMGIVFFDEINLAPPSIQSAAYQLILDRELGEVSIADGVSLLSAGNRIEDRANVFDLPLPLQNRFSHVTLKPPVISQKDVDKGWLKWALNNGIDDRIITFLTRYPEMLNPEQHRDSDERAFATPRSWGKYCNALIKGIKTTDYKILGLLAGAAVGHDTANQFIAFLKFREEIDLNSILKDPSKAGDIKKLDLQYSLLSVVAEWYDVHHGKDGLDKVFKIAEHIPDEFAILMLRFVKNKHPHSFRNHAMKLKSGDDILVKFGKYLLTS